MDKEIKQIKINLQDIRESLYKMLDEKLSEHSLYYYHKKKGIGYRSLDDLVNNRDKMHIESIIKALQKMT
jgi:hypothetical protein